jgi:hypothetical protein
MNINIPNNPRDVLTICLQYGISDTALTALIVADPYAAVGVPTNRFTPSLISVLLNAEGKLIEVLLNKNISITKNQAITACTNNGLALRYINEKNLFTGLDLQEIQVAACTNTYKALAYCIPVNNSLTAEINAAFN